MSKTREKIWKVVWTPFGVLILVVVYPVLEGASWVADKIKGRPSPRRKPTENSQRDFEEFKASKTITFKFRNSASIKTALERISDFPYNMIACSFPDKTDPELATWYMMKVDPLVVEQVVAELKEDPDVQFAYEASSPELF